MVQDQADKSPLAVRTRIRHLACPSWQAMRRNCNPIVNAPQGSLLETLPQAAPCLVLFAIQGGMHCKCCQRIHECPCRLPLQACTQTTTSVRVFNCLTAAAGLKVHTVKGSPHQCNHAEASQGYTFLDQHMHSTHTHLA